MARPKFPYKRSDETYEVVRDHVAAIAREYPCCESFIYGIKDGTANDPYPPFRHWFKSCAYGGGPVEKYLRDLNGIAAKAGRSEADETDLLKTLTEKIEADSASTSKILDAFGDRDLDRRECHEILDALDTNEKIKRGIRLIVERRLAELAAA